MDTETRVTEDAARAAADRRELQTRHDLILGKPPRLQPQAADDDMLEFANRLRRAALGEATPPLAMSEIPEIVPTLMRHADLWERVAGVSMELLGKGVLPVRERELAVLRITWLCQAPYAWGEHVKHAKNAGISGEEIERVIVGAAAPDWDAFDRAIIAAAEELHSDAMISDATWATLAERFDEKQLFELATLIGQFTTVAYFQNALRLRLAKGNPGLSAR